MVVCEGEPGASTAVHSIGKIIEVAFSEVALEQIQPLLFCLKLRFFKICMPKHHQQIMRNVVLSILVIFIMWASAKELLMAPIGSMRDSMHKLVDKLMDRLPHYHWLETCAKELESLVQHTVLAAMNGRPGARELANVAYGAAGIWKSIGVATVGQQDE